MDSPYYKKLQVTPKPARQAVATLNVNSTINYGSLPLDGLAQLSTAYQQVNLASGTVHEIEPLTGFLQLQHPIRPPQSQFWKLPPPRPVPSMRGSPKPKVMSHAIRTYGREPNSYVPATYTWDEGPGNVPGTAKYYKSRAYREKKVNASHAPSHAADFTEDVMDRSEGVSSHRNNPRSDSKSLVMIFSKTNARRERENRKVHLRQQRQNRRA